MLSSPRTYGFWLALFRMYIGFVWIEHALGKLLGPQPFGGPGGFLSQFIGDAVSKTSGPYHDFLASVVMPNIQTFGYLVEFGELTTGVLLFFGLFTRLGALLGIFLALNYWFAKGQFAGLSTYGGTDIMMAAACAVNLLLPTGRFFGLDALIGRGKRVRAPAPQPAAQWTPAPPPRPAPPPAADRPTPLVTPPPEVRH